MSIQRSACEDESIRFLRHRTVINGEMSEGDARENFSRGQLGPGVLRSEKKVDRDSSSNILESQDSVVRSKESQRTTMPIDLPCA